MKELRLFPSPLSLFHTPHLFSQLSSTASVPILEKASLASFNSHPEIIKWKYYNPFGICCILDLIWPLLEEFFHFYKYELHFWAHIPLKFGIQSEVWKSYFQIDIYLSLWQRLRSFTKPFSSLKDNFLKWMMFDVLKLVLDKIEFECLSVFSAASVAAGAINLRSRANSKTRHMPWNLCKVLHLFIIKAKFVRG